MNAIKKLGLDIDEEEAKILKINNSFFDQFAIPKISIYCLCLAELPSA